MEVRRATEGDGDALRELWHEFMDEVNEPEYWRGTWDDAWTGMREYITEHIALIAEDGGRAVAYELAKMERPRIGYVSDLYVRPEARRRGIAKELLARAAHELREQGAEYVTLNVNLDNHDARTVYRRLGFREESVDLLAAIDPLSERVAVREAGPTFGSAHVQTDDQGAIVRAVVRFVPRLSTSRATVVSSVRNGWVAVYDEVADRDPAELRQLGAELSNVTGAVVVVLGVEEGRIVRYVAFDRGQIVDEYLSVPEYYGPLAPGDVVALRPNPTVMSRLVGADPDALRRVARIAPSPADLPSTSELLADVAHVLGLEGATHSFGDVRDLEGAVLVEHR
jgi:ribosomal protein S18 acetylase RimI-like enzyme